MLVFVAAIVLAGVADNINQLISPFRTTSEIVGTQAASHGKIVPKSISRSLELLPREQTVDYTGAACNAGAKS